MKIARCVETPVQAMDLKANAAGIFAICRCITKCGIGVYRKTGMEEFGTRREQTHGGSESANRNSLESTRALSLAPSYLPVFHFFPRLLNYFIPDLLSLFSFSFLPINSTNSFVLSTEPF